MNRIPTLPTLTACRIVPLFKRIVFGNPINRGLSGGVGQIEQCYRIPTRRKRLKATTTNLAPTEQKKFTVRYLHSTSTTTMSSRTITDNRKLFAGTAHAEAYRIYRPTYPPAVFEAILEYLAAGNETAKSNMPYQMAKQYRMAVDMACGTGQATPPLAEHFAKVIGCDVSQSQIEEAKGHNQLENVEFHVAPCEDMPLVKDESVDLVTCALAFHWVDPDKTYPEVNRILRPGGVLAIYAYGLPDFQIKEARDAYNEEYTSPQLKILLNHYRDVKLPFANVTRKDDLTIELDVPLSNFIGYLESYSAYQGLLAAHPSSNVLQEFSDKWRSILAPGATDSDDPTIHVSYPIFIVMGRKK